MLYKYKKCDALLSTLYVNYIGPITKVQCSTALLYSGYYSFISIRHYIESVLALRNVSIQFLNSIEVSSK